MDLLPLLLLYPAALLPQHCLLVTDLQQQLCQLSVLLQVLAQPVVLVLERRAVGKQGHRFCQCLRRNCQHLVIREFFGGVEVLLWLEVVELVLVVQEHCVFVHFLVGLEQVQFCLQSLYFLNGRRVTRSTTERWCSTMP